MGRSGLNPQLVAAAEQAVSNHTERARKSHRAEDLQRQITRRAEEDMAQTRRDVGSTLRSHKPALKQGADESSQMLMDLEVSVAGFRERYEGVMHGVSSRLDALDKAVVDSRSRLAKVRDENDQRVQQRMAELASTVDGIVAEGAKLLGAPEPAISVPAPGSSPGARKSLQI